MPRRVLVTQQHFDTAAEIAALSQVAGVGAVVTFTGVCRDEDGRLLALTLEHYPGMAEAEIDRIAAEAEARWPLLGITVIHRSGRMVPGDPIVLVATASAHRQAAFAAADFLMDFLKTRAPFWKKEELRDRPAGWIEAKASDDTAMARWDDRKA